MPAIRSSIKALVEELDTLRPLVLGDGSEEDAELRSLIRRMYYQLDDLQRHLFVSPPRYQKLLSLLASLLDAEHGALLKGSPESPLGEDEASALDEYIANKRTTMQAAQQDMPAVYQLILRCSDLLGTEPASDSDITVKCKRLEMQLREHLHDDASLREELNQLTSAFENSLDYLTEILREAGGDSPELQQVKEILRQDLPDDPKKAHALLQHARESLLQAGDKLNSATESLKENMQQQVAQAQALSQRLEAAEQQARSDPLTGLANRRKLTEFLLSLEAETAPQGHVQTISTAMLDIDHFKSINDQYGHDTGDEILTLLASLLTESIREGDMVARLGGEEFCLILPDTDTDQAFHIAEKLREAIELHPFETTEGKIAVTTSFGIAQKQETESNTEWLKRADQALYQSKAGGRNRVTMVQ